MTKFSWKTVMKYRSLFFGAAAIWIVFFHMYQMTAMPKNSLARWFLRGGNMGVDIFLVLSAIGLGYSVEKNSLRDFYKNRFLRLWVPFLIICVPYYMWRDSVTGITLERIRCFLLDITAVNFWLKEKVPFWYVSLATLLYALYPFIYRLYKKNKNYMIFAAALSAAAEILLIENGILTHAERGLSRIPVFLVGIYVSDYVKEDREIGKRGVGISSAIFLAALAFYTAIYGKVNIMYTRFIYAVMTVPFLIVLSYAAEKIKDTKAYEKIMRFFTFFGGMSLELYLVHNAITRILKYYDLRHFPWFTYYLWIFPVSAVLAVFYNRLAKKLIKKLR